MAIKQKVRRPRTIRPQAAVAIGFAGLIGFGALLLGMPFSAADGHATSFPDALFTSASAVSLTGLITLDTATHWSLFGKFVIMVLIQLGGLGFMTTASLLVLLLSGRLSLRASADAQAEGRGVDQGEVRWVIRATIMFSLILEALVTVILFLRFYFYYDYSFLSAFFHGLFHAISAFNNAGFALYTDNVMDFQRDPIILLPLAFAFMIGGLGFPVLLEIVRRMRTRLGTPTFVRRRWSLSFRFTMVGTLILIIGGITIVTVGEWNGALAGLPVPLKLLNAFFSGVTPRTAGFNSLDFGTFHPSTLLGTDIIMVIGAGTGGTAGGVKVTTVGVLVAAVLAEIRAQESVVAYGRRVPRSAIRQALAVLSFAVLLTVGSIFAILWMAPGFTTDQVAFEVCSAFSTVGLSTGITSYLPRSAQFILIGIMFAGRIGPVSLATGLAMRRRRRFEYPEERPFIG